MLISGRVTGKFLDILLIITICISGNLIAYKLVNVPAQLELVVIFFAAVFYPVLRYPKIGIYLLFLIMPLVPFFRRLYYLQYSRPSADPLIVIGDILIILIIGGLYFEFKNRIANGEGFPSFSKWILFYFLYLVVRVFFMNILPLPEAVMRFRFYGPAVLMFFAGVIFGKDFRMLENIWVITFLSGIIAAIYGIKQLTLGYSEFEKLWFSSISFTTLFIKGVARPFSFFQSPAAFADYMLLAIISVVVLSAKSKNILSKYIILFVPLFIYSLLITSVRSNWIGAIVIVFLWVVISSFKNWKLRVGGIITLIFLFLLSQLIESILKDGNGIDQITSIVSGGSNRQYFDLLVKQRVSALSNPFDEHSLLSRLALWKFLLASTADPVMAIFGRGIGGLSADSLYFTYLAELGYPGMAFIIFGCIILIVKGFHVLDNSSDISITAIAKGITIMNIVFVIVNITGTHIHGFPGDIYFWFWNGVLAYFSFSVKNIHKKKEHENIDHS